MWYLKKFYSNDPTWFLQTSLGDETEKEQFKLEGFNNKVHTSAKPSSHVNLLSFIVSDIR